MDHGGHAGDLRHRRWLGMVHGQSDARSTPIGLRIEICFITTFTNRFFAR
jgi:hypothetical protein